MADKKRVREKKKLSLHQNNKHKGRYDLKALCKTFKELSKHVAVNKHGDESLNFFDPEAVKALNKALLLHHYDITYWDIPKNFLCPPIPGRADYIHHIADLLETELGSNKKLKCLDVGVGANCIYPIIGVHEYEWTFVGSDVDEIALKSAGEIVAKNELLKGKVVLRQQKNLKAVFEGVITANDTFDIVICNPPFHSSAEEAAKSAERKVENLKGRAVKNTILNFGGQSSELWFDGGALRFMQIMIKESYDFRKKVKWFSCLVAKGNDLQKVYKMLDKAGAEDFGVVEMGQGNKKSRIVAWRF